MVPSRIEFVDELPALPNGKVDRKTLAQRPLPRHSGPVRPASTVKDTLSSIWAEVLDVGRVEDDSHFVDLGGDSLLAVRILCRVAATWSLELTLADLLDSPTVAACARLIESRLGTVATDSQTFGV
jgi:acyl carrier protein